ncbi:hypothetical protein [Nocardia flavorosea]|uniref:Uncharacterized protein n=1 Tax=Nocardia flavorosea TaxID=53429 RepID=A0A846YKZ9_9NOCA|nr:hypothetical protein [Nocardia flavorosea]NKY58441.1 hypothetical protein [Nocardia flavorosea]
MTEIPALPFRAPGSRAMAATLRLLHTGKSWVTDDPRILQQIADGLRALEYPTPHYANAEPIGGYAHAHQVMAVHAAHRCPRYEAALDYTAKARP